MRRSLRPAMPPASFASWKATSQPTLSCRPYSREGPENGALMPNEISPSVTGLTAESSPGATASRASARVRRKYLCIRDSNSIELDGAIGAGGLEHRPPDLVRALMIPLAEADGSADAEVEVADPLERLDERLRIEVLAGAPEGLDEQVSDDVPLERHEARALADLVLLHEATVPHDGRRLRTRRGDDLRHDHVFHGTLACLPELVRELFGAHARHVREGPGHAGVAR